MTKQFDVFLSYAHEDAPTALMLAAYVERTTDLSVWTTDKMPPGAPWDRTIMEALRSASSVLVLLTPAASRSAWVAHELGAALMADLPVVAVVSRPGLLKLLPAGTRVSSTLDAENLSEERVVEVLSGLRQRGFDQALRQAG